MVATEDSSLQRGRKGVATEDSERRPALADAGLIARDKRSWVTGGLIWCSAAMIITLFAETSTIPPDPEMLQSGFHDTGGEVSDYKGHVRIVKSGTDWRGLSVVQLRLGRGINGETIISNMSCKEFASMLPKTFHC